MRKIILFIAVFTVTTLCASARIRTQKTIKPSTEKAVSPGVRAGMNIHKMTYYGYQEWSYRQTVGFHAGVVIDIRLHKKLYLQPGILFSTRGGRERSTLNGDDNTVMVERTNISAHYLDIPFLVQYRLPIGRKSAVSLEAGPCLSIGVGGKTKRETIVLSTGGGVLEEQYITMDTFFSKEEEYWDYSHAKKTFGLERFDVGVRVGGGFHIHGIYLGINYNIGLLSVAHPAEWWTTGVGLKNSSLSLTAGYNF
jgi:hypothetical protein